MDRIESGRRRSQQSSELVDKVRKCNEWCLGQSSEIRKESSKKREIIEKKKD